LAVDGLEDHMLKVRDCLNLTIGDWQTALKGTAENPAVINDDREDTIKVNSNEDRLLYTTREVAEGIKIKEEDLDDVTTDSGVESDKRFDSDSEDESDFDDVINGDEDVGDENI
jgi:hypothetical protein